MTNVAQNAKRSNGLLNALKKQAFEKLKEVGGPGLEVFEQSAKNIVKGIQNSTVAQLNQRELISNNSMTR